MTEEDKKKKEAEIAAYKAAVAAEKERRKSIVAEVAKTPAGAKLLRLLHDICGFNQADRVMDSTGKTDLVATALNSERRNVYLNIRGLIPSDALKNIEGTEEIQ